MQTIKFGKTGLETARFGLGCMRLPKDQNEANEIVRYAIDHGVNYLDTAYLYKDNEVKVGKALEGGYRHKAIVASKSPIWDITTHSDFEKFLDIELQRLQTDYIDVYLLHSLGAENFEKVIKYDGFSFLDKMIQKGKIRHKAFSFHGTNELFKKVFDSFNWEMTQIQLNVLDEFQQAGLDGLKFAAKRGVATVIMEPLRGGHLINDYPKEIDELLSAYKEKRSLIEWAFRWLYNFKEADVVLSGVQTMEQLKQNIAIFDDGEYDCMSDEDMQLIRQVREIFEKKSAVNCTSCRYCMPCPFGVEIPEIFKLYNNVAMMEKHFIDKLVYKNTIKYDGHGADKCTQCGVCLSKCPQSIDIPNKLKSAEEALLSK